MGSIGNGAAPFEDYTTPRQGYARKLAEFLLQEYFFIPLDIFQKSMHNKPIRNKLEAWLTFLSSDAPETIASLIEQFPEFEPLYMDIYEIWQNTERIMGLFSKELEIMDRNTVQFMIDQQADKIEALTNEIEV